MAVVPHDFHNNSRVSYHMFLSVEIIISFFAPVLSPMHNKKEYIFFEKNSSSTLMKLLWYARRLFYERIFRQLKSPKSPREEGRGGVVYGPSPAQLSGSNRAKNRLEKALFSSNFRRVFPETAKKNLV
jgi:hypothetical protein